MTILAGRYEILQQLGGGSFAITYLAKNLLLPSQPFCVVKQLRPDHTDPQILKLFEKEAVILEKLGQHPQIPQLFEYLPISDKFYIIQEYIHGQDLSKEIQVFKQLSEKNVINLLDDVLQVLSFVHTNEVIHRDIKPQNLVRRQSDGRIFLIDFGAVKEIRFLMLNSLGQVIPSIPVYSPGYTPREQYLTKPCFASDIYALGITAIQALTGILPINFLEDSKTAEIIWQDKATVSDTLAEILTTMVRRDHTLRYPSAIEALEALQPLLETPDIPTLRLTGTRLKYFQEVEQYAQEGEGTFSIIALEILEQRRTVLGISEQEAKHIESIVLSTIKPSFKKRLEQYEKALIVAVNQQYPFDQLTEKQFKKYRQLLGLTKEDVASIEERWLYNKSEYEVEKQEVASFLGIPVTTCEFQTVQLKLKSLSVIGEEDWEVKPSLEKAKLFIEDLGNSIFLEMIAIPGGTFLMGSPEDEEGKFDTESPQHPVQVQPFFMGKYPITQSQWQAVAALPKIRIDLDPDPSHFKDDNLPIERVSWDDVQEFCARLSQKTGKKYRLPSEAEWEYACRAKTTTPFYFGETISTDLGNYNGNYTYGAGLKGIYREKTTDVRTFPANAFGLHDMHGNVWEWCEDEWHDNYTGAPTDSRAWISSSDSELHVVRGGSWGIQNAGFCRSATRSRLMCEERGNGVGFRVVLDLVIF